MDELDFCRLADAFTLTDAAALIIDELPSKVRLSDYGGDAGCYINNENNDKFQVALQALINAVNRGSIPADRKIEMIVVGVHPYQRPENRIKPQETTVSVDDLKTWLESRGFRTGFFFPENTNDQIDYLNPKHQRYAPKLAAAVHAWQAISDEINLKSSPKQALEKWLRENAAQYGLADDEGKHNETAIEECSKVANWSQKGGAPKTPG